MSSIDDIWADMQSQSSSAKSIVKKVVSKKSKDLKERKVCPNDNDEKLEECLSPEQVLRNIRSLALQLENEDVLMRRKALTQMNSVLFEKKNSLEATEFSSIFRDICKPLFKRMSDPVEKCRELSLRIVSKLFTKASDLMPVLGYYFPCLMQRLPAGIGYDEELKVFVSDIESHEAFKRGRAIDRQDKGGSKGLSTHIVIEPSEEIRYLLCDTLTSLISKLVALDATSILQPYFHDIVIFTQVQLKDPYPELKILACQVLETLTHRSEFEIGMKFYAVGLVRAILPLLRHRHAKVRLAAIKATAACVTVPDRDKRKGAGTEAITDLVGFREENVLQVSAFYKSDVMVNYLAELVCDGSVAVREALVDMLTRFLTQIGDRYDHQQRLLPYILDLLNDDTPAVSKAALHCLSECGRQYEEENRDDVLEKRQYGVDGDEDINLSLPLPSPFTSRPSLGIRLFVKGNTKRFLGALTNELTNWISRTRLKSAGLLKVIYLENKFYILLYIMITFTRWWWCYVRRV